MTVLQRSRQNAKRTASIAAACFVFMALFSGLGAVTPAGAQGAGNWAYVYAGDWAATEPYSPDNGYQFNSTGALNTISRTDVGVFSVVIPGLAKESQTQVTTESEHGERCSLANTVSVTGTRATEHTVRCFAIGGDPADIGFSLLQYEGGLVTPSAYVWANDPAAETYTPDTRYQFNSAGEEITISRADAGTYQVNLPGQGTESGNIQISAANSGPGVSCEFERWGLGEANLKTIQVYCFDSAGTRVDSSFTLLYVDANDANAAGVTASGAFLIADHNSATERYTTGRNFQFSTAGALGDSQRNDFGDYTVFLPEVGVESGTFQVTASGVGDSSISCEILNWGIDGTTIFVNVTCFNAAGEPVDSFFNLTYVTSAA